MRALAQTVLKVTGLSKTGELIRKMRGNRDFSIYETANHSIFRSHGFRPLSNYVVSEYFDDVPFAGVFNGIRNENLERLSFPDDSFDIVISSDVLEHVSNLDDALAEIKRVLKPGGHHIFTVPADPDMERTIERAVVKGNAIIHLLEPVMHGDTIRKDGILAFRDFGRDAIDLLSRKGFGCTEYKYSMDDMPVTSVYVSRKTVER